jgi:hypothetical protein
MISISAFEKSIGLQNSISVFRRFDRHFFLNFPNSLCSAIFVSIQFQICTVILAFRDINLQSVFKIAYPQLLARRPLAAICIKRHSRLKQY